MKFEAKLLKTIELFGNNSSHVKDPSISMEQVHLADMKDDLHQLCIRGGVRCGRYGAKASPRVRNDFPNLTDSVLTHQ